MQVVPIKNISDSDLFLKYIGISNISKYIGIRILLNVVSKWTLAISHKK